jgi:Dimerisation domain
VNGFQVSHGLSVATQLGIPDLLASGPRISDELGEQVGADRSALYRLLRALATVGVLEEGTDRLLSLTELGEGLRSDVEASLAGWAAYTGSAACWPRGVNRRHWSVEIPPDQTACELAGRHDSQPTRQPRRVRHQSAAEQRNRRRVP